MCPSFFGAIIRFVHSVFIRCKLLHVKEDELEHGILIPIATYGGAIVRCLESANMRYLFFKSEANEDEIQHRSVIPSAPYRGSIISRHAQSVFFNSEAKFLVAPWDGV